MAFSGGYGRLQGAAQSLLAILVGIEIVLLGLWTALGGGDNVVHVFKKILHIGFWVWIVQSSRLCKAFVDSLVQAGLFAGGGGNVSLIMDPSRLAGYGLDATEPLAQKIADLGLPDVSELFVFGFGYLAILACFFIMAINVFLAVLEYYLFAALVGIFLPFGLLSPTKFLAEKAVGAVVSASVKLMVLAFVTAVIDPVLQNVRFTGPEHHVQRSLVDPFDRVRADVLLLEGAAPRREFARRVTPPRHGRLAAGGGGANRRRHGARRRRQPGQGGAGRDARSSRRGTGRDPRGRFVVRRRECECGVRRREFECRVRLRDLNSGRWGGRKRNGGSSVRVDGSERRRRREFLARAERHGQDRPLASVGRSLSGFTVTFRFTVAPSSPTTHGRMKPAPSITEDRPMTGTWTPDGHPDTPYMRARQEWDNPWVAPSCTPETGASPRS